MKLSKLKRLIEDIYVYRSYFVPSKCLIEDMVRDKSNTTCRNCEYNCLNKCTAVGMRVLR